MELRKTVKIIETINTDGVGEPCEPITRIALLAVIKNPFAGRHGAD